MDRWQRWRCRALCRYRREANKVEPIALAVMISLTATGVAASLSVAVAKIVVTKNKVRLTREALKGVEGPDRPAVLQALAEVL